VVSSDITKPFGPRICADAIKDEFTTLDGVNTVASTVVFDTTNGVVKAPHGANGYQTGELYTTELKSGVDVRVVKLSWTGSGVTFYVSTDGNAWSQLQKDQPLSLGTSSRSLYLKAVLAADASSFLGRYLLQINPTGFNLFTGKMLTEETGLVYFGARWYDPEIGRWISPDPSEDGENWYSYCGNNPVNYVDPDGYFRNAAQAAWLLTGPLYFVWDTLKGVAGLSQMLIPYPYLPMPVNATIVGVRVASAVIKDPKVVLDFAQQLGYGLVSDVVNTVKNFGNVVLGSPTDEQVRKYGKSLTGTVLTVMAAAKIAQIAETAGAAGSGLAMFRRGVNIGEFSGLSESMTLKNVRRIAGEAGIGYKGIKIRIIRDPELIGRNIYGFTHPKGNIVDLYPDAFQNAESLVKTLGHERIHVYQVKTFGVAKDSRLLGLFETAAINSESAWMEYFRKIVNMVRKL
jgi:RHS repeat-associated protein